MESQQLPEPLISEPRPEPSINPAAVTASLIIAIALLVLIIDPSCDQPLVPWTGCIIGILIVGSALELLKKGMEEYAYKNAMIMLAVIASALLMWGHWAVFKSETCSSELWIFALSFTLLGDVVVVYKVGIVLSAKLLLIWIAYGVCYWVVYKFVEKFLGGTWFWDTFDHTVAIFIFLLVLFLAWLLERNSPYRS